MNFNKTFKKAMGLMQSISSDAIGAIPSKTWMEINSFLMGDHNIFIGVERFSARPLSRLLTEIVEEIQIRIGAK